MSNPNRIGKTIRKSDTNKHLDHDAWLEVFPAGNPKAHAEIMAIRPWDRVPSLDLYVGQSALLVRRSAWENRQQ